MEENNNEDFKDFGEEQDFVAPNIDELEKHVEEKEEDIVVPDFEDETQSLEENNPQTSKEETPEKETEQKSSEDKKSEENTEEEVKEETPEEEELRLLKEKYEENSKKLDQWEELDTKNDIVKKYIVYIDKDNIGAIDELSVDERNSFINSAIKLKFENDDIRTASIKKKRILLHSTIMICTMIIFMPVAVYLAHLSIVATFKNYKYSQDNFEKLYRESFSKSPTYMKAQKYIQAEKNK